MTERIPDIVAQDIVVSMEYTLTVDDQLIDSSEGYGPLQFLQGHRNVIPGLETELFGLQIGETKEITVAAKDAYGEYDDNAFVDIPRDQFPPSFPLEKIGRAHV